LAPRHPPHALSSLAALAPPSGPTEIGTLGQGPPNHPRADEPPGRVTTLVLPQALQRSHKKPHATEPPVPRRRGRAAALVVATLPLTLFVKEPSAGQKPTVGRFPSAVFPLTGSRCTLACAATLIQPGCNPGDAA
jgi:hypothetical protein